MNKQKLQIWLPLFISLSMVAGMFIGYKIRDSIPGKSFFSFDKRKPVDEILDLINSKYVDTVDLSQLSEIGIQTMLSKLDPHSIYIPTNQLDDINNDIQGNFYGIGVEFDIFNDTVTILNVLNGSPSEKVGLKKGDQFLTINNKIITGKLINADSIRQLIRGPQGTKIDLTIKREQKEIKISIPRSTIPINSIDASFMLNQEIGYIKINKFSSHTYSEFMTALHSLKNKGLKKLILDLRDNGGGVLEEAIDIADEFLEGDKLITYTEGAHMPKKEYRCRRLGQFEEGKLIVLSNEGSASASEVLMGALQDWDRATIIGSRSFGKGLVQEQFDLSDHSAVRLTIARYFSPTGRCIQRSYANGEKAYYDEIDTDSTSRSFNDSSKTFTTPKGKKVYGGGGISPDIVMTDNNIRFSNLVATLFNKGTLNHFAFDFYRQQINVLKNYTTPLKFISEYSIPQSAWSSFIIYSNKDSVDIKNISNDEKQVVLKSIKNFIGRNHFSKNEYFEILMNDDKEIKKSMEVLK